MKKTLIIALCCLVAVMAACKKKPVDPTPDPEPANYAEQYVGSYLGSFDFTIVTMNNEAVTNMTFPIDAITMNIAEGEEENAITATVTVDNETRHTTGTAMKDKADFELLHLIIDKPDQGYRFDLDLKMEGNKITTDTLGIAGTFSGNGTFVFMGETNILDEVSGNVNGILGKQ